ncbi:MAG: HAMP domain-containing histidine kinase [Peptococcaceae bacterium]|nr:HAMP domain-containing histidine kinase [Peptococcaceae bacterium]
MRRIESGWESIELGDFDAAPVLMKSVDKMRTLAERKNIDLSLEVEEKLPVLKANPDRLEQVMINLIENALRFTPMGGSTIVRAVRADGFVKVSVTDSGPGIPGEEQELIWEKFYKVDKSRARKDGGGTGLGLAIVKRLVEKMGGSVGVESIPGKGTTFYFTLMSDSG